MPTKVLDNTELTNFSKTFDQGYEDEAVSSRGEFIKAYPKDRLKDLTIEEYVIGHGTPTYCARVEAKSKAWANIQGATANKFGIYFGKTKSDPKKKYRFTQKFGSTKSTAFSAVKTALLSLIEDGETSNFAAIENNPLSQMLKAKILSLYFPETYLNVCSSEHLSQISTELGLPEDLPSSKYQTLLLGLKSDNEIAKDWSNPKFMSFLYGRFINQDLETSITTKLIKPKVKLKRKVNFGDLQAAWDAIGKLSEDFAISWERNRLSGLGFEGLASKIVDRRDIPSYGYDFLSFSSPKTKRYIEVKSLGRDRNAECYRFYLSENEHSISKSIEHREEYYFYLVRYGRDGKPADVIAKRASDLYNNSELSACAYVVRTEFQSSKSTA